MSNVNLINFNAKNTESKSGRRKHCLASADVVRNGQTTANLVIDFYSPRGLRAGFYAAFRAPGYTERQHPSLRVWLGESLEGVDNCTLEGTMERVARLWIGCFEPNSKALQFICDPRLILN